jgi:uncharacterized protein (UPF0333 family)
MAISAALEFIPYILVIFLVAIIAIYYFSFEKIKSMHEEAISAMRNAAEQVTSECNFCCKNNRAVKESLFLQRTLEISVTERLAVLG